MITSIAFVLFIFFYLLVMPQIEEYYLNKTGIPATAKILRIEQTGTYFNYNPQVRLFIEVYPEKEPPYKTEVKTFIGQAQIPSFQAGKKLDVLIDSKNKMKVIVKGVIEEENN